MEVMDRRYKGILTARQRGWRHAARRLGATVGTLALLLQCLVFVAHATTQAQAQVSPFNDPAAWCGMPEMAPAGLPDQDKSPLRTGPLCPVCQTVQAAAAGLVPPSVVLLPPSHVELAPLRVVDGAPPATRGHFSASPRGPPILV